MKICVAQTRPVAGDIEENFSQHELMIRLALEAGAEVIVFPELSLTGYEPKLAKKLALSQDDSTFNRFQNLSDEKKIVICAGMPIKSGSSVMIGMLIFIPYRPRQTYCKKHLHFDEIPYFVSGSQDVFLDIAGERLVPAICYESLQPEHIQRSYRNGASVYMASVAKSVRGLQKAFKYYSESAKKYSIPIIMANCVGPSDNFHSSGRSSIWKRAGELVDQLSDDEEGLLIFDTKTGMTTR